MSDYIDRQACLDALFGLVEARRKWISPEGIAEKRGIDAAICSIIDLRPADVEPVVRYKDCKYNSGYCNNYDGFAHFDHFFVQDDDYCSRGARMDGEQDG